MTKRQRELLSDIAHESHLMGRVYNMMGEQEKPAIVYERIEELIEMKIKQYKFKPYVKNERIKL